MESFAEAPAADLARQCLTSFERCLHVATSSTDLTHGLLLRNRDERVLISSAHEQAIGTAQRDERLENRLADFNLWADGVGAFAAGRGSLDSRFKQRPDDLFMVKGTLAMLHQFLEGCAKSAEQGLRIDRALHNIDSTLDSLALLAVAIRQTGKRSRLQKADGRFNPEEHQELRAHLEFIARIRASEREHESDFPSESRVPPAKLRMQKRLIEANLRRRNRFIQAQRHAVRLQDGGASRSSESLLPGESTPEILASSPDMPSANDPEPVQGTVSASESLLAPPNATPTVSGTSASVPESMLKYPGPRSSNPATAKTEITLISASARYPRPKIPDSKQKLFQCPCCCQVMPKEDVESDSKWRKHLAEDVCPYTCIVDDCPSPNVYYSTRSALEYHIRHDHAPTWHCPLCDSADPADDALSFENMTGIIGHFNQHHNEHLTDDVLPTLLSSSAQHSMGLDACPLCESSGPRDSPELVDHILEHIHDFALRSLPWPAQASLDLDGEVGDFNLATREVDRTIQWLMEATPHVDSADQTLRYPPSANSNLGKLASIPEAVQSQTLDYFANHAYFADEDEEDSLNPQTDHALTSDNLSDSLPSNTSVGPRASVSDAEDVANDYGDLPDAIQPSPDTSDYPEAVSVEDKRIFGYRLLGAMVSRPGPSYRKFLPRGELERLVNVVTVEQELSIGMRRDKFEDRSMQSWAKEICGVIASPSAGAWQRDENGNEKQQQKTCRRIFAILVICALPLDNMFQFLKEGISDQDLPFRPLDLPLRPRDLLRRPLQMRRSKGPALPIQCLGTWRRRHVELFCDNQWSVISPFFARGPHNEAQRYVLEDDAVLPFTYDSRDEDRDKPGLFERGGFGEVFKVRIHRDHHNFQPEGDLQQAGEPEFAVKKLYTWDGKSWTKELEILKRFSSNPHPHLVSLLATYEQRKNVHLLFYWADADLERYWSEVCPRPSIDRRTVDWIARQCYGIADGIWEIHQLVSSSANKPRQPRSQTTDSMMVMAEENDGSGGEPYGRHGDIKPRNILWFKNTDDPGDMGTLVITDVGLVETNSESHSSASKSLFIRTYCPPEAHIPGRALQPSCDIWALGCVYLDFLTWMLGGWQLVDEFSQVRVKPEKAIREDSLSFDWFFELETDSSGTVVGAAVKSEVTDFIDELHHHPACTEFVHDFLDLIQNKLLVVESEGLKRLTSVEVCSALSQLQDKLQSDQGYGMEPKPWGPSGRPELVPPHQADNDREEEITNMSQ